MPPTHFCKKSERAFMLNEQELLSRIERLEKQNKRFRIVLITACLLFCAAITTAQKSSGQKSPRKVNYRALEAGSVTIKDEKGTDRLKIVPKGIEFFDAEGEFSGAIRENVAILNEIKAGQYSVFDPSGRDRIRLAMNGERPSIQMLNEEGSVRTAVGQEAIVLLGTTKDAYNSIMSDRISIRDASASTATLGVTETVNKNSGSERKTSAATITLFGKDGKVVWQAP
jgi:hypothetical protein